MKIYFKKKKNQTNNNICEYARIVNKEEFVFKLQGQKVIQLPDTYQQWEVC